ncbi:MAG: hypothetical protein DMG30_21415 [Acidobacteria bacterium]|nr:MAG: hypothetical protein DMG30_21415 [Acidobacteriota bacterium]
MLHGIRSGEPALNHAYGTDLFTYFGRTPAARMTFNEAMAEHTFLGTPQIIENAKGYLHLFTASD